MEELKLCDSEYRFMCAVWDNEPLTSGELVKICNERLGWKKSTTYTVLKKMCEKGITKNENTVVSSVIEREKVQTYASEQFVESTFKGSLPNFLVSFFSGKKITESQADQLKKLIDEYKE